MREPKVIKRIRRSGQRYKTHQIFKADMISWALTATTGVIYVGLLYLMDILLGSGHVILGASVAVIDGCLSIPGAFIAAGSIVFLLQLICRFLKQALKSAQQVTAHALE